MRHSIFECLFLYIPNKVYLYKKQEAMTIDDLLAAAEVIKNETGISKNTHIRVGAILENMINYFANNVAPVTSELIKDAIAKSTSGIRKGMTVGWDLDLGPIPAGFALANGNGGAKINGVNIQDRRGSFSIGYDPAKFPMPYDDAVEAKGIENYGKVGNVGGLNSLKLSVDQLPPHSFKTVANAHDSNHAAEDHADEFLQMDSDNRAGNNDYKLQVGKTKPTLCGTDIVGKGLEIDKRPRYITVCYITKYSDDIDGGGSGSGSSTETAPYVLSGLDAKIDLGMKASHTILESHNFTADKIYPEVTVAPTDYDIIIDIKKNGVSIFSTKPRISVGNLHSTINPVLVTSPTVFSVGDIRTITVDQVGGSETGKNLVLSILINKTN